MGDLMVESIKLYHFTHYTALRSILRESTVRTGRFMDDSGNYRVGAVSFTTDVVASPGHGLPDGRRLLGDDGDTLAHVNMINGDQYCINAGECLLGFVIPFSDPKLVSASKYYENLPRSTVLDLELSAYFPTRVMTMQDRSVGMQKLQKGEWEGKSPTWYYYLGDFVFKEFTLGFLNPDGEGYFQVAGNSR